MEIHYWNLNMRIQVGHFLSFHNSYTLGIPVQSFRKRKLEFENLQPERLQCQLQSIEMNVIKLSTTSLVPMTASVLEIKHFHVNKKRYLKKKINEVIFKIDFHRFYIITFLFVNK